MPSENIFETNNGTVYAEIQNIYHQEKLPETDYHVDLDDITTILGFENNTQAKELVVSAILSNPHGLYQLLVTIGREAYVLEGISQKKFVEKRTEDLKSKQFSNEVIWLAIFFIRANIVGPTHSPHAKSR